MTNTHQPKFISFASPKGGVGKSTTCLAIAGALLAAGEKVRIIDFDQTETIYRWYTTSPTAQGIPNLTVEKGPTENLQPYLENLWQTATDYVLIDLAGSLSDVTLIIAVFATLTITPAKVSEPDVIEANKMAQKLHTLSARIGKPINHLILLNEVPSSISNDELDLIDQIDRSSLQRFKTLIHRRSAFSKTFSRGTLPHLAVNQDPKALAEINNMMLEIHAILEHAQQKAEAA
jgi:chromosome partitioning protein